MSELKLGRMISIGLQQLARVAETIDRPKPTNTERIQILQAVQAMGVALDETQQRLANLESRLARMEAEFTPLGAKR